MCVLSRKICALKKVTPPFLSEDILYCGKKRLANTVR
jgi:hypothetical protein